MYGYIHLKNFKCYEDEFINFKDSRNRVLSEIHFIGDNLSGKSSVISVFSFLQEMVMLNYNHDVARRKRLCLRSRDYKLPNMERLVRSHKNYFTEKGIELEFEIIINNNKYYYKLVFNNDNKLEYESLIKATNNNDRMLFERDENTYRSGRGVIRVSEKDKFDKHFKDNKANYTLLSMIYLKVYKEEMKSVSDIINICNFILLHHINNDSHKHLDIYNFDKDDYRSITKGVSSEAYLKVLHATEPVIKELLNSLSSDVIDVKYDVNEIEYDMYEYGLLIKQQRNEKSFWMKEEEWPPLYDVVINIVHAINSASFNGIVVLDNITNKLHYNTLKKLLVGFNKYSTGQTIFTSSSPVYLNDIEHSSIYLLKNESDKYFIQRIVDDFDYRSEHNIRSRYERGLYGTIDNNAPRSSIKCQENFDGEIERYFEK